jgi:membrane associated rhomboid family serine protease
MTTDEPPKRMLRELLDDARDFPATMALGAVWVVVFVMMVVGRLTTGPPPSLQDFLLGNVGGAHSYGDMTLNEIFRGEVWRVVTCTFVHYNVLHVGMNLYGLYQLGCLVESWYGSAQFLAIYLVIGGGGNVISALIRHARGLEPRMHSGGGSTVVLGLVALCAVVGWRARSRIGDYLRGQMVGILLFTAFLGQVLPIIDNWGHAGGALVGALVGFMHRILIRTATRPVARWAGVLATLVMLACGAAQWRDNRIEGVYRAQVAAEERRVKDAQRVTVDLVNLDSFYPLAAMRSQFEHSGFVANSVLLANRQASRPAPVRSPGLLNVPLANFRLQQGQFQARLDAAARTLGSPPTEDDFRQVRRLLAGALERPPSPLMVRGFQFHLGALIRRSTQELLAAQARRSALARKAGID